MTRKWFRKVSKRDFALMSQNPKGCDRHSVWCVGWCCHVRLMRVGSNYHQTKMDRSLSTYHCKRIASSATSYVKADSQNGDSHQKTRLCKSRTCRSHIYIAYWTAYLWSEWNTFTVAFLEKVSCFLHPSTQSLHVSHTNWKVLCFLDPKVQVCKNFTLTPTFTIVIFNNILLVKYHFPSSVIF
jgi:hypothetical protein